MSMFENNQYRWRETCFVLFQSSKRPTLDEVVKTLALLDPSYQLQDALADDQGRGTTRTPESVGNRSEMTRSSSPGGPWAVAAANSGWAR